MRLLLVGKGAPDRGGIAAFLETLLTSPLTARHDLRLLNLTRDEVPGVRKLTAANIRRTLTDIRAVWGAARGCDLVHVHSALARNVTLVRASLLTLAGRARGCRVIVHAHSGRVEGWFTTPLRRRIARLALAPAHRVVAVAEGGHAVLSAALGPGRVALVPNGVDTSAYGPPEPPHSPPRILYAGVLTPRKGVTDLLRASALLAERGVPHELLLAGGTPEEGAEAEAEVRRLAGPATRILGPQPHAAMPALYRSVDVFCLPSWGEAMPLSLLEAMASGLAVVASRVGDIPRAVEEGVTGRLVEPRRPEELADTLQALLAEPELRRRLGAAARRRVEQNFSTARTVAALDALYRQLDGGSG